MASASNDVPAAAAAGAAGAGMSLDDDTTKPKDIGDHPIRLVLAPEHPSKHADITHRQACLSGLLAEALKPENKRDDDPEWGTVVLNKVVTPAALDVIVEYLVRKNGDKNAFLIPAPLECRVWGEFYKNFARSNDRWDNAFFEHYLYDGSKPETKQLIYAVILAANYLEIKPLLHNMCAIVAFAVAGMPTDQIKGILDPNVSVIVARSPAVGGASSSSSSAAAAAAGAGAGAAAGGTD